ncbi:hypothetical protein CS542_03820 [Pedobacter sp. IW39]|nr:hypothetical protein CS542_03820 [Pedobacter sp. IW39]
MFLSLLFAMILLQTVNRIDIVIVCPDPSGFLVVEVGQKGMVFSQSGKERNLLLHKSPVNCTQRAGCNRRILKSVHFGQYLLSVLIV